uniref:Acyl_transf_3 domain-containing protein n=1 Tax=Pristionchus pacificus TaxID=54126 RepID=A0A8R1YBV3_PRIPA
MLWVAIFSALFSISCAFDARSALRAAVKRQRIVNGILESDWETLMAVEEQEFSAHHLFSVLSTIQPEELAGVSLECKEDLEMIIASMVMPDANSTFYRSALLPMLDSAGKKAPAILKVLEGAAVYWEVGVCMPASCSSKELMELFRPEFGEAVFDNPVCRFTKPGDLTPDINAGFYVTLSIMGVIVAICIISGLVDFYFAEKLNHHSFRKNIAWRLFMACSLYSNVASIFDVAETNKTGQISSIHCIRFFSMVWVLMGHLAGNYVWIVVNPVDVLGLVPDLTTEALTNGFFSVDSFFFISGVLLSFMWLKTYCRQHKETMSPYGWAMFYVHRILRLSPAFYILVIFYSFVLRQLYKDTPLSMNAIVTTDYCSTSWWVELLYLQNWVDLQNPCLGYSWYLATDLQMYIFTPLLLIPLAIKPIIGFIVAVIVLVVSTATNIFLVYHYHWPAAQNGFHPQDPEQTNLENYNMLMYGSPLIRCQIYIMGIIVGWLLHTKKQLRIHPLIYLPCWILGLSIMLTALFGLHDQTNGLELSLFWRAMYSSLSRPAWGVGLATIVIMCHYGYGGPINSFMSCPVWIPLSRLSYCAYLIHVPITQLVLSQTQDEVYFSNFMEFLITRVLSITVCTFLFSVFWSSCFELTFANIEKLLLGGARRTMAVEKEQTHKDEYLPWDSDGKATLRFVSTSHGKAELSHFRVLSRRLSLAQKSSKMFTTTDTVHAVALCSLDVTAIALNALLVYAIATRTPPPMRSYSILLLNNAFVDILSASASVTGIARLVNFNDGHVRQLYVFVGPCSYLGRGFCHLCQTIHLFFVCHSTVVLLHSFCFRLYILRDNIVDVKVPSSKITFIICALLYGPTVLMMHFFYSAFEYTPPELMAEMHFEEYPTTWYPNILDYRFVIALSFVVILSPSAMVIIFFVRRRLIGEIRKMKDDVKEHHSHIAKALTYQMLLPAGVALASAAWLSNVAGIWTDEISERLVMTASKNKLSKNAMLSSLFALGSPLINLTFLPPYRRMFGKQKKVGGAGISFTASTTSQL